MDNKDDKVKGVIAGNLKATVEKAERYVLLDLSSAALFLALSLAEPKSGDMVEWELLGFPLSIEPPLALVVLYFLCVFSGILANNLFIHVRDLVALLGAEQTAVVFTQPSILTVSPLFSLMGTVVPGILICVGIWFIHDIYPLDSTVWILLAGFALAFSIGLYASFWKFIHPYLLQGEAPKKGNDKA